MSTDGYVTREVYEAMVGELLKRLDSTDAQFARAREDEQRQYNEAVARQRADREQGLVLGIASGLLSGSMAGRHPGDIRSKELRDYLELACRLVRLSKEVTP